MGNRAKRQNAELRGQFSGSIWGQFGARGAWGSIRTPPARRELSIDVLGSFWDLDGVEIEPF